jgi:hypothetical protein
MNNEDNNNQRRYLTPMLQAYIDEKIFKDGDPDYMQ